MRIIAAFAAALLVLSVAGCRAPPSTPEVSEAGLQLVEVQVRSARGTHRFTAELAETADQQARGLMFRETLAPDAAMLFPFTPPRPASFWMKDTLIPLDMLFVRQDGSIAYIAAETEPYSELPVGIEEPVSAVLEIAGGRAAALGIVEGDHVSWAGGPRP